MRFSAVRAARQIVQDMSFNAAQAARNTAALRPGPPPRSLPSCYVARVRDDSANRRFLRGLGRAFAGAILFGLPLLMTMEMWWLGFTLPAPRLAVLLVVLFPVLVLLSWHAGFEPTFSWKNDVVDALVAYAVGFVASAAVLGLLGLVDRTMEAREVIGKIALQAVPASIGTAARLRRKPSTATMAKQLSRATSKPTQASRHWLVSNRSGSVWPR